jgi:hypothetical protein
MNYISFSLWGKDPMYTIGMIKNLELAQCIYPGWKVIIHFKDVERDIIQKLKRYSNIHLVHINNTQIPLMMTRFEPPSNYDVMIVRDADSRINIREKLAVDEWLASGKTLHIMRDHPYHGSPIMGGMWGIRKNSSLDIKNEMIKWTALNRDKVTFNFDQLFLIDVVYKKFLNDQFCHDSCYSTFPNSKPFPSKLTDYCFVGEKFYADDKPSHERKIWVNFNEQGHSK